MSTAALVEASNFIRETAEVQKGHNTNLGLAVGRITGSFETIRSGAVTVSTDSRRIQEAVTRLEAFTEESTVVVEKLSAVVASLGGSAPQADRK